MPDGLADDEGRRELPGKGRRRTERADAPRPVAGTRGSSDVTNSLTCPKCAGTMRNYERNGIHVDQCADCRGIFLDRGELEQLVDAENRHYAAPAAAAPAPAAPAAPPRQEKSRDYDRDYDRGGYK